MRARARRRRARARARAGARRAVGARPGGAPQRGGRAARRERLAAGATGARAAGAGISRRARARANLFERSTVGDSGRRTRRRRGGRGVRVCARVPRAAAPAARLPAAGGASGATAAPSTDHGNPIFLLPSRTASPHPTRPGDPRHAGPLQEAGAVQSVRWHGRRTRNSMQPGADRGERTERCGCARPRRRDARAARGARRTR